jgi:outer membrane murein-binding lipoprotein Lpp
VKLDWNKVVSNSITVLVATVFIGAASYLWQGVQTIDERIDKNLSSIRATQNVIAPKVDQLEIAIQELIAHHQDLAKEVNATEIVDDIKFELDERPTIEQISDNFQQQQQIP